MLYRCEFADLSRLMRVLNELSSFLLVKAIIGAPYLLALLLLGLLLDSNQWLLWFKSSWRPLREAADSIENVPIFQHRFFLLSCLINSRAESLSVIALPAPPGQPFLLHECLKLIDHFHGRISCSFCCSCIWIMNAAKRIHLCVPSLHNWGWFQNTTTP